MIILLTAGILFLAFTVYNYLQKQRMEGQLRKAQVELESLKEIVDKKDSIIENVSFKVRTPVSIIMGYLELLKQNSLSPSLVDKYVGLTILNTEHLIEGLNDFPTLLSPKKFPVKSKFRSSSLDKEIRDVITSFTKIAELKKIDLLYKSNIKEGLVIEFDYKNLRKIIYNLLSSSIKNSFCCKPIYITTILHKNELTITIKDEGIGLEKEVIDSINSFDLSLDQLIQTDGIGFPLVHNLISSFHGTFHVESKEGVGSLFVVKVPLDLQGETLCLKETASSYENLVDETKKFHKTTGGKKLPKALIIEKNLLMVSFLQELFSPYFDCIYTFSYMESLEAVKKTRFDIIICDLHAPSMNRLKLKLKELNHYRETPFLMVSDPPLDNQNHTDLRTDDFIPKPFSPKEIFTKINQVFEHQYIENIFNEKEQNLTGFGDTSFSFFEKLYNMILENINQPDINLKQLSREFGFTQRELSSILLSKTGLTLVQAVKEIRLLKAYELLENKSYKTVKEVIFAVGLNSRSYFYKAFTSRFGIKPYDLLKNEQQQSPSTEKLV